MLLKLFLRLFCILSLLFLITSELQAQDRTGETVRITTTDGNIFIGVVESESEQQITLRVEGIGEINLEKSSIRRVQVLDADRVRDGEYWFENPQGTRYFFAPNAIGLKQGAGYYQNAWIFFNNVNYGISDNFSIGAGTVPIFLFGVSALPLWVLPKLSIPVSADNVHVAAGALIGGVIGEGSTGFGLAYGNATFGDRDKNITVGLGYGYGGGEWSNTPLVNVSGLYRSGKNFQWLGEIYFLPGIEGSGFGIFGARWAPERFAVDFGIGRPLSATEFIGFPWLGVTIPFGNR
jgi:hypothetical protein